MTGAATSCKTRGGLVVSKTQVQEVDYVAVSAEKNLGRAIRAPAA